MSHDTEARLVQEALDRLRAEVAELRASRERLVLAADDDRRRIERDLHEGLQQQLVALAVNLQLVVQLTDADPAAAKELLEEMGRDLQRTLNETAQLAERIYPPLLDAGGLAVALRSAAVSAGVPAFVEVATDATYPPEVARTIYQYWLAELERADDRARVTIAVREEDGELAFEVTGSGADPERFRDRVEALGGRLSIHEQPGGGSRISGSLPLAR